MHRLICVYVVRIWQNDNRSFRTRSFCTQVISYHFGYFVPTFIFNLIILYPVWSLPVLVSYLHLLESESFRPLSRSPLSRFAHFPSRPESFHPRIVSSTFPFAPVSFRSLSRSPPESIRPLINFCFGLLIGVKLVLFEISDKQWAMNSVSDVYIHFQSWHR